MENDALNGREEGGKDAPWKDSLHLAGSICHIVQTRSCRLHQHSQVRIEEYNYDTKRKICFRTWFFETIRNVFL